ncbi:MAG: transglycosylase domain-containing protein [Nannocystaceae bacterium]|nr:transglycosylase domain-containing protein [Nannocystaceae bacterium]
MVAPSPAPKRSPSRRWPLVLGAIVLLIGGGVTAAALLLPGYARDKVHAVTVAKLEALTGQPVSVGQVQVKFGHARLTDIKIGDPEHPLRTFNQVDVSVDRDALWDRRVVVREVVVDGGLVQGQRSELEDLAKRIRKRDRPGPARQTGRIRMVPDRIHIQGLTVDVRGINGNPESRVVGRLEATAWPAQRVVQLAVADAHLDDGAGRVVHANAIATQTVLERSPTLPTFPLRVEFSGLGTQVTEQIAVAGTDGFVEISDISASRVEMDLQGGFADRGDAGAEKLWSVAGWLRRDLSEGDVRLTMEDFELGRVPQVLSRLPTVVDSEYGTVGGRLAVVFGNGIARAEGHLAVEGINVNHRTLARQVVKGIGFELDFAAEIDPAAFRVRVPIASVQRDEIRVEVSGEFVHPPTREDRRYDISLRMPPAPCQSLVTALPPQLIPSLQGFILDGTVHADLEVHIDYADFDALSLDGDVDVWGCKVVGQPAAADAARLARTFTHTATMRDGRTRTVRLYPGSGSFTSLALISPYVQYGVLTTEDGGFYRHRGFLPSQFETALRRNLDAGEVRLGASTITMQMVKNVLLSHERTLSRKLQEMFLTWYVETELSKERIMEIYLNVVEFGPGIYGVTRAADHYFGKHPADLDPAEGVYLALMLPSPVRRHSQYCRGELTDGFKVKMRRILGIMHGRGRIDDLDFALYGTGELVFDLSERGDPGACRAQIEHLMASRQGQRAVTGLLSGLPPGLPPEPESDG